MMLVDPAITALNTGGLAISWTTDDLLSADASGTAVKMQIFNLDQELTYTATEAKAFNIITELPSTHSANTLSDVTISGVPTEATFNQGTNNLDGTWTLSQAQLADLTLTFNPGFSGIFTFDLAVTSTDPVSGDISITNISVPITVGNLISGTGNADAQTATTSIDHVSLGDGVDSLTFAGEAGDYDFAVLNNKLEITHIASGATNTDLLLSVETLIFDQTFGSVDVANLHSLGVIADMTSTEYDSWLSQIYDYNM